MVASSYEPMADRAEEEPGRGRGSAPAPPIIPLQRTLVRRVVQVFSAIMLLWFGVYLGLNDRALGRLISKVVTSQVRGKFVFAYAHYDYWSSLGSLILNTAAPVHAGGFELRDPNGDLVMKVDKVEARVYIGELIRGLLRSAVSAPFGRGVFIELHLSEGRIRGGTASVHPISVPRPPGTVNPPLGMPYTEVNIVSTMSGRKPKPEDAPPSPGHVRIVVDGAGVQVEDVTYEMAFPGWHGRVEKLRGGASLRFSTDASETRPGLISFYYEVSPLTAERGTLVLGTPEGAGEFVFPLENIALRRFGARASQRQNLVFRGQLTAAGATVELDGSIVDTYCDPGVKLQMSFEHGAGLVPLVPGGMLRGSGRERGRVNIAGAFSEKPPMTPQGKPAPCLAESWHKTPFPGEAEERAVVIEGQVAGVDALVATIPVHEAGSQFRLAQSELYLSKVVGSALGGEVQAEPMRISFVGEMPWSARIFANNTDPSQVVLVPPFLRPFVIGKLHGGFRISGHLARNAHPERVAIEKVEATLDRLARHDPLPHELRITGSFLYTPEQIGWRNLRVTGDTLALDTERGRVAIESGRLDIPELDLHGKGAPMSRIVQSFGIDASLDEASAKMRLGGSLTKPDVSGGELSLSNFDFSGRRFTEASTGFALHDGTLAIDKLSARGPLGSVRGDGTLRLFYKDLSARPSDPAITLHAAVEQLTLEAWNKLLPMSGLLNGQIDLGGTLGKPTGSVSAQVPKFLLQDSAFRDVAVTVDLTPETIAMRSLSAALGSGFLKGHAMLRREGDRPVRLTIEPGKLPLSELPGMNRLPFEVAGTLSGSLNVLGSTRPLEPRLDGRLQVDGFTINGRRLQSPVVIPDSVPASAMHEPLFSLLGMAVRTLTLNQGELVFKERTDGSTYVRGTLFGAFDVEGLLFLDPLRPHGEVSIRFGCPPSPVTDARANPANLAANRTQTCDLLVSKLLPDLRTFGDVSVSTSGVLTLRFGEDPRQLFLASNVATCPLLSGRTQIPDSPLGLPIAATLQLSHALLEVHTVDEDGEDQRYRLHNKGDVFLCSDGHNIEMGRVQFLSQRLSSQSASQAANQVAMGATPASEHGQNTSSGEATLRGIYSPEDTNLLVIGQIRLELLEDLLRGTFRHTHGDARVNLSLRGKIDNLKVAGHAELQGVKLVPHAIDSAIDVPSGVLELLPDRATLRKLSMVVDGATTLMDGTVEVKNWTQLDFGQMNFTLHGDLSARLLQWSFAQNLAESRGSLNLRKLHVTGTFDNPEVEGSLVASDLFLNVRRFHELLFKGGSIALSRGKSGAGRITLGCPPGQTTDCEPLEGIVDGDGKVQLNGRIDHNGLGNFVKVGWHQALDNVRLAVLLENIRHTQAGVYNVEVSTPEPGLQLIGNRNEMRLLGDVEVVAGRYMQDFDFADRILSLRRVIEEETPFWEGDPFLSGLILGLNVRTRGTFRVLNSIADLRLATTHFTISGPLESVAMGGVIRVESGYFNIPGLHSEFEVRGDSKLDFSTAARWPDTPWVDVRGSARELDQYDQQRNIELALRGKVTNLRVDCLSSENMSANDCASFLVFGDSDPRKSNASSSALGLQYGNSAAKLLSGQLITNQITDPLRQKLRLDTVRIQFGVSTFDVQLCKRFGLYLRMCGLAEWGVLGTAGNHYRGFGELLLSDLAVGQVSLERIEHSLSFLRDTINRFKMQAGLKLPLRY